MTLVVEERVYHSWVTQRQEQRKGNADEVGRAGSDERPQKNMGVSNDSVSNEYSFGLYCMIMEGCAWH